jgi:hypothetical protein
MTQRFSSTIILLIFLFSVVTKAESPYLTEEPKVATDTSEFNRQNKIFNFYVESVGGSHGGRTYNGSYFIRPDLQIMAEISHYGSRWDLFNLENLFNTYSQTTEINGAGLHLKYFMGNSIFFRLGINRNEVQYSRTFTATSNKSSVNGNATYAVVGFGNDWQWENFVFGFDWYRLQYPIASELNSRQDAPEDNSLSSKQDELLDRSMGLIGIHIGASF